METEGVIEEVRRLRAFETPVERTKRKARANAKRGRVKVRFQFNKPGEASENNDSDDFRGE